jgi:hypothetical protein
MAFICVHSHATCRSWMGMDTMWWLDPKPVGHVVRLNFLNPTKSKSGLTD